MVIDRPTLQDILLSKVGDCVRVGIEVVGYEKQNHDADAVVGILADGTRHEADMLIGSDGIWSKVRRRDATSRPRCSFAFHPVANRCVCPALAFTGARPAGPPRAARLVGLHLLRRHRQRGPS